MAREEERKYDVGPSFVMPDLTAAVPPGGELVDRGVVTLTATYYDTPDLRLARSGASLRYRQGDRSPWTVKLPTGTPGVRHEISRAGEPGEPPAELVALVTAATRGAPIAPVVMLRSQRRRYELRDAAGQLLAEVADDDVTVGSNAEGVTVGSNAEGVTVGSNAEGVTVGSNAEGVTVGSNAEGVAVGSNAEWRFREVEVERAGASPELLDAVAARLIAAGALVGQSTEFRSKYARALGPAANRPPDLPAPEPLPAKPRAGDVLSAALRRSVGRLLDHDPLVRLGEPLPDGDTPVHQLRVGCRRLRSDLRTFGVLVDAAWANRLRRELRWLARRLGAVRDLEVLRGRLWRTAADPLDPVDPAAVARIDAHLAEAQRRAEKRLRSTLASDRYRSLLDALVGAAQRPRTTALAAAAATEVLPPLVAEPWQALVTGDADWPGAGELSPDDPDAAWHAVRVRAKRARYAVEAVAEPMAGPATKLGRRLSRLQDVLGEHQDAAVAADTWRQIAWDRPGDAGLLLAAGRLYERERAAIARVRAEYPAAWHAASRPGLVRWLG
ncbi:CYTH and CHAD domain-containing protein [Natronosporangium hydrolyticum]|uniref:CYTH and CHAD domain-containing protein n=1 Tax=Natronosporangium hydrolyticum TaxID=2811111 RepID=A0A895YGD5_9ACTN|nr:CYTH and CHAD domain-containing protein [Natronosporangium hydrolyticum]QSB13596.1 CYTH and CHAD domain-containing protein [Natronosporangium hydrolyticum]